MRMPDGTAIPLKVRSLVGLLPLCAATVFDEPDASPELVERALAFAEQFGDAVPGLAHVPGANRTGRRMLALVTTSQLRQILKRDARRGRVPRAARHPRDLPPPPAMSRTGSTGAGQHYEVRYLPAESDSGLFGGNSNWRGPVWFPMNLVIMRALFHLHRYYGDDFKVECPTGSGRMLNLRQVAIEIGRRLSATFVRGEDGRRPVYGGIEKFQTDPHWRDLILFHEYFHGDNGAGLGASHQTGGRGPWRAAALGLEPR